jgi:hypothetical protein
MTGVLLKSKEGETVGIQSVVESLNRQKEGVF